MESFGQASARMLKTDEPPVVTGPLKDYWNEKVSALCELKDRWTPTPQSQERHRIYCYLLMGLIYHYWNGYKYGRPKSQQDYPLNAHPSPKDPEPLDGMYFGHNIAALAVDRLGYVLDFDFNHNDVFNSSAEHAEARLVRRLYSHAQVSDSWGVVPGQPSSRGTAAAQGAQRRTWAAQSLGNAAAEQGPPNPDEVRRVSLAGVTIYTSLESCAQCAGIMALAQIQEVVYLQTDPQYFFIGRILRNLTTDRGRAPLPIAGHEIDLPFFEELDSEFKKFALVQDSHEGQKFWNGIGGKWSSSVTSFLCTAKAREIFRRGGEMLDVALKHGRFDGSTAPSSVPTPRASPASVADRRPLTNAEVQAEAVDFRDYARRKGLRGTPHNL